MRFFQLIMLLLLTVTFSCEEPYVVQCDDCVADEPLEAKVEVRISDLSVAELLVYEGELDDNILYEKVKINLIYDRMKITVPVNKKFTFVAVYDLDREEYRTVDSTTPRVYYSKDQCDEPCYYVYDTSVDLQLKFH